MRACDTFILSTKYPLTCGILTLLITLTSLKMRRARSARNIAKEDVSLSSPELDCRSIYVHVHMCMCSCVSACVRMHAHAHVHVHVHVHVAYACAFTWSSARSAKGGEAMASTPNHPFR